MPIRREDMEGEGFSQTVKANKQKRRRRYSVLINLILILAVAYLAYAYMESRKEVDLLKGTANTQANEEAMKKEAEATEADLAKLVLLPSGEEPQILIIKDANGAIKEQPALVGVVDGDRILLYMKSQKAYVYSPSRGKIVNILPLTIDNSANAKSDTADEDTDK